MGIQLQRREEEEEEQKQRKISVIPSWPEIQIQVPQVPQVAKTIKREAPVLLLQ